MSALLNKLKKIGSLDHSSILSESKFFTDRDMTRTNVPIINVAFSGKIDGGFGSGLTVIAGPSKHFKTNIGLACVQAYLKKYKDAVCLFYDSEFGTPESYMAAFDIDTSRVLHLPIANIEEFKFDISQKLEELTRDDKVIILIDSVGNLASKKELDDSLAEKSAADMTRAKQLKSVFRIATPQLTTKDIPCIAINHTYKEQGLYPKDIVSGGTGIYYSANTIIIVGRSQEKKGTDIVGYKFTMIIEKSRTVVEKSKFPFTVSWEKGINRWSGLLDIALELGYVEKPKQGWYTRILFDPESGEVIEDKNWRLADTETSTFWEPILKTTEFASDLTKKYSVGHIAMYDGETELNLEAEDE